MHIPFLLAANGILQYTSVMSNKKTGHKKIFLINRDFQLRYTRSAVFVGVLSTILTCILILYPLYHFRILRIATFVPKPFLIGIGVATLVNVFFVYSMGIRLTHRIAGPMFSLVKHMRIIGEGRMAPDMNLRKDDEMKYVIRNFNDMIDGLKREIQLEMEDIGKLEELLETAESSDQTAKIKEALAELKTRVSDRLGPEGQQQETVEQS